MFPQIESLLHRLANNFDEIPDERKDVLRKISEYIIKKMNANENCNLVYICTHNSRRSHFGQLAAALAAYYYKLNNVYTYSGGTEATAFNKNAINALIRLGFEINSQVPNSDNQMYHVLYGENQFIKCFSKLYNHESNPKQNFAAIMTCSEAEQNCPFIPGAEIRIGTTYKDPKVADNSSEVNSVYTDRFKQITIETLYAFSLVSK